MPGGAGALLRHELLVLGQLLIKRVMVAEMMIAMESKMDYGAQDRPIVAPPVTAAEMAEANAGLPR